MAQAIILKNGNVVRKGNITEENYFTTGHLASFKAPDGTRYTCAAYLDIKKNLTFYVQESSFYTNIETGEYSKMKIYNDTNWGKAEENDIIEIQKRQISSIGNPSYCWNTFNKAYHIGESFSDRDISLDGFTINTSKSYCNNSALTNTALEFFNKNVILSTELKVKEIIADVAQLINNIDKYIYQSFTSGIDLLKENQKTLWRNLDTSSLSDSQKEAYYNQYYIHLLDYYNLVKKRLYILNNSTNIENSILIAMSMHPAILIGLSVSMKIKMLNYLVKNILSKYIDKIEYEEFIVNLVYSFDANDTNNINLFLDSLISPSNSVPDTTQKEQPKPEEFEIFRNSITLFEAIYVRMSQSWDYTESIISWVNYIPGINFEPVLTRYNFVDAVYRLWRYSKFNPYKDNIYNAQLLSLVEDNQNTTFKYSKSPSIKYMSNLSLTIDKTAGPVVINYKSKEKFGMFDQNFIFEFTGYNKICAVTNDWEVIKTEEITEPPLSRRWFPYGYYDIFQPVSLIDHSNGASLPILTVDNADPTGDLDNYNSIIPIFYIKYIADLSKRKNAEFLIFRTADIVTFFRSGGGLINKLSHIRSLSKFQQIITLTETIQFSAEVTDAVLGYTASCNGTDSKFCQKLKILLGWVELSVVGNDAMSKLQKKIAAKRFIKEVDFGEGVPNDFNTTEGQEFISKIRALAAEINDLELLSEYKEEAKNRFINKLNRDTEYFENYYSDNEIDELSTIAFGKDLPIDDIAGIIHQACRIRDTFYKAPISELTIRMDNIIEVRRRGFPYPFTSKPQFNDYLNNKVIPTLDKFGLPKDKAYVGGSGLTSTTSLSGGTQDTDWVIYFSSKKKEQEYINKLLNKFDEMVTVTPKILKSKEAKKYKEGLVEDYKAKGRIHKQYIVAIENGKKINLFKDKTKTQNYIVDFFGSTPTDITPKVFGDNDNIPQLKIKLE
ncbi:hypothetical protein [Chryseobacterium hagamense]|uniref:Uncharacterized protein n=1 Tax=Chryseobacterium hagamense TaxID=395935 RepID=A0A511YLG3_9FLAO|nr:hypothetical protein [Chryseobacterium hagamense]GEN75986.1 hypothetical protein CHA01nite_17260 [Chryseobacterium hagamense]